MAIETATMSERGQIVIPKQIRDLVGAKENTLFSLMALEGDVIVMRKVNKEQLMGDLSGIQQQLTKKSMAKKNH